MTFSAILEEKKSVLKSTEETLLSTNVQFNFQIRQASEYNPLLASQMLVPINDAEKWTKSEEVASRIPQKADSKYFRTFTY